MSTDSPRNPPARRRRNQDEIRRRVPTMLPKVKRARSMRLLTTLGVPLALLAQARCSADDSGSKPTTGSTGAMRTTGAGGTTSGPTTPGSTATSAGGAPSTGAVGGGGAETTGSGGSGGGSTTGAGKGGAGGSAGSGGGGMGGSKGGAGGASGGAGGSGEVTLPFDACPPKPLRPQPPGLTAQCPLVVTDGR